MNQTDCIDWGSKILSATEPISTPFNPNIIKCHDLLEDDSKIYVITDPVRGKSLYMHILEKGEMDHSWREDGVRDATETSERANRCDASVRGDFCF